MIQRGPREVPYGRRGSTGPTEVTVGGPWPYDKCWECGGWIKEHVKMISLEEWLKKYVGIEK